MAEASCVTLGTLDLANRQTGCMQHQSATCRPGNARMLLCSTSPGVCAAGAGVLVQLSDRPIMCSAAQWDASEVVVGSSDHALYVVDIQQGKKKRTLYSKTCGHTE